MNFPREMELLYQALASDFGIIVQEAEIERLKQRLYAARKGNTQFNSLSILTSPTAPTTELWIAKRPPDAEEA